MSDAVSNPAGSPQCPPQPLPPIAPYGPDPREPRSGGSRLWRAIGLLILLMLLWIVPSVVEQVRYSWTHGKERAEAEVARQLLDEGRGPTIGQYRTVVKAVQSSVVGVKASRAVGGQDNDELSGLFGPGRTLREQDQGSGVIVDAAGYIITNYHVVDRATDVRVELSDGETHRATIVGIDPGTDLAVLKIDAADLKAAPWGKSSEMEVGDPVLAIGSPFGLSRTVTAGILSATGRHHVVIEHVTYQDFLQTDAAVNPGNSGGPLVNMHGEIIGINTAIVGPTYQGISFAIPSDMVHDVYSQLLKSGKVARGWLGVDMKDLSPRESQRLGVTGVMVGSVVDDSPAAKAGIQQGDVITKFNGKRISDRAELGLAVAWSKIGDKAKVTVRRGGETKEIDVDLGQRPPDEQLGNLPHGR